MKHDEYDPTKYAELPTSKEAEKILERGREVVNLYNREILPFNLNRRT